MEIEILPRYVRFLDVKGTDSLDLPSYSLSLSSQTESLIIPIGNYSEIHSNLFTIQLLKDLEPIASTTSDLKPSELWLNLTSLISIHLSISSVPNLAIKLPKIPGFSPQPMSQCEYLQRLQLIEKEQQEIQTLLAETRDVTPSDYHDILTSSPRNPAKRGLLKKKTLENAEFFNGYQYKGYFNVTLEDITCSESMMIINTTVGMHNKMRALRLDANEFEFIEKVKAELKEPVEDLEESMLETKGQFDVESAERDRVKEILEDDCGMIEKEIESIDEEIQIRLEEIQRLKTEIQQETEENSRVYLQEISLDTKGLRNELNIAMDEIKELENNCEYVHAQALHEFPEAELQRAVDSKNDCIKELENVLRLRDASLRENAMLNAELLTLESEIEIQADMLDQCKHNSYEQAEYEKSNDFNSSSLLDLQNEFKSALTESASLIEEISNSLTPLASSSSLINEPLNTIHSMSSTLQSNLDLAISSTTQLSAILTNNSHILTDYSLHHIIYLNSSTIQQLFLSELEKLSNTLLSTINNNITAMRLLKRAEDLYEEKEMQHISLCKMIGSSKSIKPTYIAVQSDSVDMALSKFLNSAYRSLKENFKRISKGNYIFGSCKIEVILEGELFVIVNGKPIKIDEFIKDYSGNVKERSRKPVGKKIEEQISPMGRLERAMIVPLAQILKKK